MTSRLLLRPGDANAFFGLVLDNMTQLVILSGILIGVFGFPVDLVLERIVPGSAVGVLVGNLAYSVMAIRLARRTGRNDVTAMPIGIDTVSLFGFSFGLIGPAYRVLRDADQAWHVASAAVVVAAAIKLLLAFPAAHLRRLIPRAALLGPIAAIAIALIAFFPALKMFHEPVAGFLSLAIILSCLIGRRVLPARVPPALGAVAVGIAAFYIVKLLGLGQNTAEAFTGRWLIAVPWPSFGFADGMAGLPPYLALVVPFALAVVVGDMDVTESAAVSGDEYSAGRMIAWDGIATLAGGLCGGVLQTTAYIGHPAYKRMGGGAGYTLATGLFIGFGAMFGYLGPMVSWIPEPAVAPILIFVGLEIMAQSFLATATEHYKAITIALIPVLAELVLIQTHAVLGNLGQPVHALTRDAASTYHALLILANGFIITALLWAAITTRLLEDRLRAAAAFALIGSVATFFGVVHSPFPDGRLFLPWDATATSVSIAVGYGLMAGVFLALDAATGCASRLPKP